MDPVPLFRPISYDDQFFFLHIPKTAGTSFTSILDTYFAQDQICPATYIGDFLALPEDSRLNYRLYRGHIDYTLRDYLPKPPIYITMLRHPIQRVISDIRQVERLPEHHLYELYHSIDLLTFVHHEAAAPEMRNLHTQMIAPNTTQRASEHHPVRVHDVERAKEHLDSFEFFGLTERFDDSVALLNYTFGWRPTRQSVMLNTAPKEAAKKPLPQNVIDSIIELNQYDLQVYEYACQRFEKRYRQMMFELLDRHALSNSKAPELTSNTPVVVSVIDPMPGYNWHSCEVVDNYAYRWTGPENVSVVDVYLRSDLSYRLEMHVITTITEAILNSLELRINGHQLALEAEYRENTLGVTFKSDVPSIVLNPQTQINRMELCVAQTLRPMDIGVNLVDDRALGIAVASIRFMPINVP
jgi:hypothetical protein